MPVKAIKLESYPYRALAALPAAFFLTLAFFCVKWALANTASLKAEFKEVADLTVGMAPDDPQTHYAAAVLHQKTFLPEDLQISLTEFEKAAALAPHNYLLWLEVGHSRERNGDSAGAERALRRALALAPNYAQAQWALGNNLLRQARTDEAFVEIRRAVEGDDKYTNPAASTAWQIFDGDLARVRQAIGDSSRINAALVVFLSGQKRFDEAFAIWDALPADEKRVTFKQNGEGFYAQLLEAKKYRAASKVYSDVMALEGDKTTPGQIANGGFESALKPTGASVFEWQIADSLQPQIGSDTGQKHSGTRSLVMIYDSAGPKDFRAVSQTVIVEPGKAYTFEIFYKADLKAAATFNWQVFDAADGKLLGATDPVLTNSDWKGQRAKFTVPAGREAVVIRLARVECNTGLCPITGRIWFDDLSLNAD
jgi:Flp pilus assembly protein TadD